MQDKITQDNVSEYLAKAKQAEADNDLNQAKQMIDAALWKAEQHGIQSGKLEETLTFAAQFLGRRGLNSQASSIWERLLLLQNKRLEASDVRIQMLPTLEAFAVCCQRLANTKRLDEILREIVRIVEASSLSPADIAKKLEQLARGFELADNIVEAQNLRAKARKIKEGAAQATAATGPASGKPSTDVPLPRKIFIGHILVRSGIVPFEQLNKGLKDAKTLELPIGEVLVSNGLISMDELNAALELQGLIKTEKISFDEAAQALAVMRAKKIGLKEALGGGDSESASEGIPPTHLGAMLIASGWLTEPALQEVLAKCKETNFPMGKQLVLSRVVAANVVAQVLAVQEQVRLNQITCTEGIARLKKLREQPA